MREPQAAALLLTFMTCLWASVTAINSFSFTPFALPVAVKSPYLNAWFWEGGSGSTPPYNPTGHWLQALYMPSPNAAAASSSDVHWEIIVRVDNQTYGVFGNDATGVNHSAVLQPESTSFSPTQTFFSMVAGGVLVNLTFLSPVNPTDFVRQSLPFVYGSVIMESHDGKAHQVQVYSDITPNSLSSDSSTIVTWNSTTTSGALIHQFKLENQRPLTEITAFAPDATQYFATTPVYASSSAVGNSDDMRVTFNQSGILPTAIDNNFRSISNNTPSTAFSLSLGQVVPGSPSTPIIFALGMIADPAIQYVRGSGSPQFRSSYFWSNFSSALDAVFFVLDDHPNALSSVNALDARLLAAAESVHGGETNYPGLVALSLRQAMATIEITLGRDINENLNSSDIMVFQKDFDNGAINTVHLLYSTMPMLLYLNPDLLAYSLLPLLEYQGSSGSGWTWPYAAQTLGKYPNATSSSAHSSGVEESANMIIMMLAHAQTTSNTSFISAYYPLLAKWGDYLVTDSQALSPGSQNGAFPTASDKANQTEVALKGIIGVAAMARVSAITGNLNDSARFNVSANSFLQQWISLSIPHDNDTTFASYRAPSSSALMYALYADQLLGLQFVPEFIYQAQAPAIDSLSSSYGVALDSNNPVFSSLDATMMMAAAINATSPSTSTTLTNMIYDWSRSGINGQSLFTGYNTTTGLSSSGCSSGGVGSIFAPLSLNIPRNTFASGDTSRPSPVSTPSRLHKSSIAGPVAGGVVGGFSVIAITLLVAIFLRRRRRSAQLQAIPMSTPTTNAGDVPLAQGAVQPFLLGPVVAPMVGEKGRSLSHTKTTPTHSSQPSQTTQLHSFFQSTYSDRSSPVSHQEGDTRHLQTEVERLRADLDEIRARPDIAPPPTYLSHTPGQ